MSASRQRHRLPGGPYNLPHERLEGPGTQWGVCSMDIRVSAGSSQWTAVPCLSAGLPPLCGPC